MLALVLALAAAAASSAVPLTPDGVPDLQGTWTNASLTSLTRPPGVHALVLSDAEAKAMAAPRNAAVAGDAHPTDPTKGALPSGGDTTIGFNAAWLDWGDSLGKVNGQWRSSWIVDPPDGAIPFSAGGRARLAQAQAFAARAAAPPDPEALQPWDRCLIGSRNSGGPGMLNNIYNSNYLIVQTKTAVAIEVEMIHEVRTVPLFASKAAAQAAHGPAVQAPWLGDSTGWWEGRTLVVETVHVNPEQGRAGPIYLSPEGRVTERFTRTSPGEILYAFEVDDPAWYARPWRAEMPLRARTDRLYEYACHEGNYALPGVMRGARAATASAPRPSIAAAANP